jgi:nucleotide-binding universal stress UspA family protein
MLRKEETAMSDAGPPQGANSAPAGGSAAAKPQAWGDHTNGIVVPICIGSDAAWAAAQAIGLYRAAPAHIYLLTVQRPLPKHVAQFFNRNDLRDFHRESGMRVLEPAIRMLDEAGVPHEDHVLVGHPAETIVQFAAERHCGQIVVDEPPHGALSMFGLGSVASQVRHLMQTHAQVSVGGASSIP